MKKVKCGVLGAGWWGTFAHIPGIIGHPQAELVAIQSRNADEARKVAEAFGVCHACQTDDELLAIEDLDAVVVSSTPNMHYAQARAALERGLHVLVEKPMTLTAAEARELALLASKKRLQLLISCPWHFTPHALEARKRIRAGEVGEVRMISILMTNPVARLIKGLDTSPTHGTPFIEPNPGSYSDPAVAGGGQVYTQISHVAAYLSYLLDSSASEIFARFHKDGSAVDIYDTLNIAMECGALISIASTGATSLSERAFELRVFGTREIIYLELWKGTMSVLEIEGDRRSDLGQLSPDQIYPHEAPVKNLIDSVLGLAENLSPGWLGVAAMEIIEAACRSARTGRNVKVSMPGAKQWASI